MNRREQEPSTYIDNPVEAEAIAYDGEDHMQNAVKLTDAAEFIEDHIERYGSSDGEDGLSLADVAELGIAASAELAAAESAFSQADAAFDGRIKQ